MSDPDIIAIGAKGIKDPREKEAFQKFMRITINTRDRLIGFGAIRSTRPYKERYLEYDKISREAGQEYDKTLEEIKNEQK